ncbi:hypothetical protein JRO89_XS11G0037600 [Xanthoceras sorbifolium]|uniref:RNase H type-1 domain-containing protein n=1 Tax=Xanthoceras sorbifolium TaxID=99658 RepID=A0ABQ8HEJ7_9ROSI|nr:hypothetical protein JRO89_XS11G0037600 [Xanthoceras sorbifolium]
MKSQLSSLDVQVFLSAQLIHGSPSIGPSLPHTWSPPAPSCIKLNSDAAFNFKLHRASLGVVFRDCSGKVELAVASSLAGSSSPFVLEAFALKKGLELALEASFSRILVESDSSTLVKAVNSAVLPLSEANGVADALAKFGINLFSESIWLEDVPPFVFSSVAEDSSSPL